MSNEFDPQSPHAVFTDVQVMDKFTTKKGGTAVKIGWMTKTTVGQQMFFGDEVGNLVQVGEKYTIKANIDGEFYRNYFVEPAGESAASPKTARRSRPSALDQ